MPTRMVCVLLVLLAAAFAVGCNGYPVNDTTTCREVRGYGNPAGVLSDFVANHGGDFAGVSRQAAATKMASLCRRYPDGHLGHVFALTQLDVPGHAARDQVTAGYLLMRWARWVLAALALVTAACTALWVRRVRRRGDSLKSVLAGHAWAGARYTGETAGGIVILAAVMLGIPLLLSIPWLILGALVTTSWELLVVLVVAIIAAAGIWWCYENHGAKALAAATTLVAAVASLLVLLPSARHLASTSWHQLPKAAQMLPDPGCGSGPTYEPCPPQ